MTVSRSRIRDLTMKIVYQKDFYKKDEIEEQIDLFLAQEDVPEEAYPLVRDRALDICAKVKELDRMINENTEGWKTARMNRVDLSIIRLALYEMKYDGEVPTRVAINEAVELAKEYGGEESPRFVNGVLARFAKDTDE